MQQVYTKKAARLSSFIFMVEYQSVMASLLFHFTTFSLTRYSAIWTAFKAAPFLI